MCTYHLMGEETGERLGSTEKRRWWARPSAPRERGREGGRLIEVERATTECFRAK
jgi:hypothetical protein